MTARTDQVVPESQSKAQRKEHKHCPRGVKAKKGRKTKTTQKATPLHSPYRHATQKPHPAHKPERERWFATCLLVWFAHNQIQ
jgi:hypothetical protein